MYNVFWLMFDLFGYVYYVYIYHTYIEIKIFAYVFALPSTNVSPSLKTYKKRVLRFECIKRDCIYIMTHGSCTT